MPVYDYACADGHKTERKESIDQEEIECPRCGSPARRLAVYREQAVIFHGAGFTKSVLPPPPPIPQSSKGESPDVHFEKTDKYAEDSYKHGKEYMPEIKKIEKERGLR